MFHVPFASQIIKHEYEGSFIMCFRHCAGRQAFLYLLSPHDTTKDTTTESSLAKYADCAIVLLRR